MSYQPPPDQPAPEGTPTRDISGGQPEGYAPPPEQNNPPPANYGPPPGASYAPGPNQPPQGPPPGANYVPPPSQPPQGGYAPPPNQQPPPGGYAPPPGGYAPPPQGSYTPPPPPQQAGGGMGGNQVNLSGINQAEVQGLIQKDLNIIKTPNVAVYEAEIPNANWRSIIISVVAVSVIDGILGLIAGFIGRAASTASVGYGAGTAVGNGIFGAILGFFGGLIGTPISFFVGAGLLFGMAKLFGGQGNDFMVHTYLLSLSWTPLRIARGVLNVIPVVGSWLGFIPALYQIYHAGLAIQAYHRLDQTKAQLAAWIPTLVIAFPIAICGAIGTAFSFGSIGLR